MSFLATKITKNHQVKSYLTAMFIVLLFLIATDPTWAVTVTDLIEPIEKLKSEIFGVKVINNFSYFFA